MKNYNVIFCICFIFFGYSCTTAYIGNSKIKFSEISNKGEVDSFFIDVFDGILFRQLPSTDNQSYIFNLKYIRKKDIIYEYSCDYHIEPNYWWKTPRYLLKKGDTLRTIDAIDLRYVISIYQKDTILYVNDKMIKCYKFRETSKFFRAGINSIRINEVFIDTKYFIPLLVKSDILYNKSESLNHNSSDSTHWITKVTEIKKLLTRSPKL